jgi:hypothetical protein
MAAGRDDGWQHGGRSSNLKIVLRTLWAVLASRGAR